MGKVFSRAEDGGGNDGGEVEERSVAIRAGEARAEERRALRNARTFVPPRETAKERRRGGMGRGDEARRKKKHRALSKNSPASLRDPGTTWGGAFDDDDDGRGIPREIGSIARVFPRNVASPAMRSSSLFANVNRKMVAARRDGRDRNVARWKAPPSFPGTRSRRRVFRTRGFRLTRERAHASQARERSCERDVFVISSRGFLDFVTHLERIIEHGADAIN